MGVEVHGWVSSWCKGWWGSGDGLVGVKGYMGRGLGVVGGQG